MKMEFRARFRLYKDLIQILSSLARISPTSHLYLPKGDSELKAPSFFTKLGAFFLDEKQRTCFRLACLSQTPTKVKAFVPKAEVLYSARAT